LVSAAATRSASPVGAADLRLLSELTDRYLASPFAHPPAPVATERTLTWEWDRPAARVRFTGVVDRSDGATIIDYKTDSELSGLAERHGTQLRLYGLALADADPQRMPRLQLYHARTGTVVDVDASPSAVAATYAELDRALEWLARDAFPATPSFSACQYCPARAYCPEAFPVGSARV
jgi:RecB family exonuclease